MTVAELITKLQDLPNHNLRVVVRGYEAGVDDIANLEELKIRLNANTEWYYGKHEDVYNKDETYDEIAIHLTA